MNIKNIIDKIRKYEMDKIISNYTSIEGWLTQNEALGLYHIAKKIRKNGVVLEIGSWKGKSTNCIAQGVKKGKVFAIDPFNCDGDPDSQATYKENKGKRPLLKQFKENLTRLGVEEKVFPLVGYSKDFVKNSNLNSIDFLFIDGDHSKKECELDFSNYSHKVKRGGFIAFHDYDPERLALGPTWVINNHVIKSSRYKFYGRFDSLWVCRVVGDI